MDGSRVDFDAGGIQLAPDALPKARRAEAGSRSLFAPLLRTLYRFRRLRRIAVSLCYRLEGGRFFSQTMRDILHQHHQAQVGRYSYGDVLKPGVLPPGTQVGAYCSVGTDLIVKRRNHPMERPSMHPFFYEHKLGFLTEDTIPAVTENPLVIGNDVWIGDRVTIVAGCCEIGNGAVIAAGAVVTKDVPPYSIVAGVPARQLRMRFSRDDIDRLEASQWWTLSLGELIARHPDNKAVFAAPGPSLARAVLSIF